MYQKRTFLLVYGTFLIRPESSSYCSECAQNLTVVSSSYGTDSHKILWTNSKYDLVTQRTFCIEIRWSKMMISLCISIGFTIGNHKEFEQMNSIFRWTTYSWRMKLIFSGSVVPMSTTDWWNMSFQLSRFSEIRGLKYFRFN